MKWSAHAPLSFISLLLQASTSSKYSCNNPLQSEDPMVKKTQFIKYLEIPMFTFINPNFN